LVACQIRCGSRSNQTSKCQPRPVGELREVTAWPETLAVTTPQERHADSTVKVSKVSVATRTAPKT
jgi:hypothetical protein